MRPILGFLFSSIIMATIFQNCGGPLKSANTLSSSSLCQSQKAQKGPFSIRKAQLSEKTFLVQQKIGAPNTQLVALFDVSCIVSSPEKLEVLSKKLSIQDWQKKLPEVAIGFEVSQLPALADIESEIQQNSCLIGLTENKSYAKSQSENRNGESGLGDPLAPLQGHMEFLGYQSSLNIQQQINQKVIVAVIDTGIDYNHYDLKNRMWRDGSGNMGANTIDINNNDPMDRSGHGTHVAGIIAAEENNGLGVAGLTGSYVELMAVKSLSDQGAGSAASIFNGMQFAIANGADVINLSIQSEGITPELEQAIREATEKGVVVVGAAGNSGAAITTNNLFSPAYIGPRYPGMISVASIDSLENDLSFFSNYGVDFTEIAAPGAESAEALNGGIFSTYPDDLTRRVIGTSQASPMVAAAASLLIGYLKSQNIPYSPGGIEDFIRSKGSRLNPRLEPFVSGGASLSFASLAENLENISETDDGELLDGSSNPTPCP